MCQGQRNFSRLAFEWSSLNLEGWGEHSLQIRHVSLVAEDPCNPNPCGFLNNDQNPANDGVCFEDFVSGRSGFVCDCPAEYGNYNCEACE